MKEQLVSFETAKLAKEKGFNISTKSYYGCDNPSGDEVKPNQLFTIELKEEGIIESQKGTMVYNAPRQSLLQKWLREVHSIYVTALPFRDTEDGIELCFYFSIVEDSEELDDILCNESHLGASDDNYETYEEALEKGLQEALKLVNI